MSRITLNLKKTGAKGYLCARPAEVAMEPIVFIRQDDGSESDV